MKNRSLSLKWQAAISFTVILVVGVGLVTYFSRNNLQLTYDNQRQQVFLNRHRAVTSALNTMQLQMMRLASHMQGLAAQPDAALEPAGTQQPGQRLQQVLAHHWDQLNFEWRIDSAALFHSNGEIASTFGPVGSAQLLPKHWIVETGQSETPTAQIWCNRSCWQIALVPVLLDESTTGVLVLIQSLAEAVLQFQSSTAADVGILIPRGIVEPNTLAEMRSLPEWQHNVVALTGAPTTFSALTELSTRASVAELLQRRAIQTWRQQDFEVSLIPLTYASLAGGATLVVLEDVAPELQRLQSTQSSLLVAAISIWALAEMLLLALLWAPMSRLQAVVEIIPKLARGNRAHLIHELAEPSQSPLVQDETHALHSAAISLSNRLDELDNTVKMRTKNLKVRSRELLAERDFVNALFDNVHAVVLTQDLRGNIQRLNFEGRRLLGVAKEAELSHQFSEFIGATDREQHSHSLMNLATGYVHHHHHESHFSSPVAGAMYMDWQHTCVPGVQGTQILSVGLDLTARKQAEAKLAWLAAHDPLTELPNRRRFQDEFDRAVRKATRSHRPGALIFLDIDQFKTVNDTCGHPTGDRLLCEVGRKLATGLRDTDLLARLGGDEFAILIEESGREGATALADKLCSLVSDIEVKIHGIRHPISISAGITLFPGHGVITEELMTNVDLAMYKAKSRDNIRSNWHLYSTHETEKQELHQRINWKARIQKALKEDRLVLHFQPIFAMGDSTATHYEALVRMVGEQGELIPPGKFIPVAEKCGMIHDIDRQVLQLAARALTKFRAQGREVVLAVNLSATAIAREDFLDFIQALAQQHQIDPSSLIFELTETTAVEDMITTANIIDQGRQLGYRFSLDDFGSGFSSWFYLRQLPVDFVKIDGSFVRNLASSDEDRLFIKAINDVAHGLGKKTIAEFVENAESLTILSELGVDYAQGYHLGRPEAELLDPGAKNDTPANRTTETSIS